MSFVFPPPAVSSVAVEGSAERFPVRRIFCVGRNYAAHAREMGRDPDREPPFFFAKPADAVVDSGATIPYPPETKQLDYEMELVVAIGVGGFEISSAQALDHVWGYAAGLDLTRRDLQNEAKALGRPWEWGKAFDLSAPVGPVRPAARAGRAAAGRIWLKVDGQTRQDADIADMIWSVPEIIAVLSRSMRLEAGDLIMTGTPAGVGAVGPGARLEGEVEGVGRVEIAIG